MNNKTKYKAKILWVDDVSIYSRYAATFKNHSLKLIGAQSYSEAVQILSNEQFDVVITDLKLTGRNGYHVLEKAKELQYNAVYFVVSGYAHEPYYCSRLEQLEEKGMELHIVSKPIPSHLGESFRRFIIDPILEKTGQNESKILTSQNIYDAVEVKPNIMGIGVDLKRLFKINK